MFVQLKKITEDTINRVHAEGKGNERKEMMESLFSDVPVQIPFCTFPFPSTLASHRSRHGEVQMYILINQLSILHVTSRMHLLQVPINLKSFARTPKLKVTRPWRRNSHTSQRVVHDRPISSASRVKGPLHLS
jgi:hypothetical protein